MKGQKREFTQKEVLYIVNNWGKESAHSMKKKFNCSWEAVCRVCKRKWFRVTKIKQLDQRRGSNFKRLIWKISL